MLPVLRTICFVAFASLVLVACSPSHEVREWSPSDHGQEQTPQPERVPSSEPERPAATGSAAAALYRMSCAGCHGADGSGNGPSKPADVTLADFRDAAWQSSKTDAAIATAIAAGTSPEHAFGERLGPAGVSALVGHLRAFAQP